jgi:uncharacterized LabA/DUF88 family protein
VVSADNDFAPAIKLSRAEGVEVDVALVNRLRLQRIGAATFFNL